jgi:hypothetical protein
VSLFSCKYTVRLLSRSLDRALGPGPWLVMRLHLLMCVPCSRYRRHLLLLHDTVRRLGESSLDHPDGDLPALSAEARTRIKNACENPPS